MPHPAGMYLLKVKNGISSARRKIYPELIMKTPERHHWRCSGDFIVNSGHISHHVLLLTLNI